MILGEASPYMDVKALCSPLLLSYRQGIERWSIPLRKKQNGNIHETIK